MKSHVNASGFPLQIGIRNLIDDSAGRHGWRTAFIEHAWRHNDGEGRGFIDIVLKNSNKTHTLLVECKRVKDTKWHFLVQANAPQRAKFKSFVFTAKGAVIRRFEWLDLTMSPKSPESAFCVIPGNSNDGRPMLERVAGELISSCEALASEERLIMLRDRDTLKIYTCAIFTTATLNVCHYRSDDISVATGEIANPVFSEVPYVRFRKQLQTHFNPPETFAAFGDRDLASAKESTVFVVNSSHVEKFLVELELDGGSGNERLLSLL